MADLIKNIARKVSTGINIGNKSGTRLSLANLPLGGILSGSGRVPMQPSVGNSGAGDDWRVKLSLPPAAGGFYRDSPLMAPLKATDGMVFPVTPTIIVQNSANYTPQELPHTNYPYYAYNNSRVDAMSIIGNFPVQNATEGQYWLASMHFLRSASKMFFGPGESQGNPPQILRLNGYGEHIFKDVPVIIEQVTIELRESVDYIAVTSASGDSKANGSQVTETGQTNGVAGGQGIAPAGSDPRKPSAVPGTGGVVTRVPTDSVFTVVVQPVYSRKKIKDKFNLKDFANGTLAKDGFI
ncbi:hypothetical protein N9U73_02760 [Candidatus Pelagibacter bacterium]|jgi:hypothetical protein|nr:hypothetical protein [Candidatus Pelagibacter bacterium]